ncbi:hypothetical protein, partial [Salmonella enterica]|uniref:hypothetical protein n=1 Tax=Salmonella enterica TaxID=28901 RepID=UPI003D32CA7F
DPRLASSITMRGHAIMRQTKALIEAQGYDVIYGDTDSTFVWLQCRILSLRFLQLCRGPSGGGMNGCRTLCLNGRTGNFPEVSRKA